MLVLPVIHDHHRLKLIHYPRVDQDLATSGSRIAIVCPVYDAAQGFLLCSRERFVMLLVIVCQAIEGKKLYVLVLSLRVRPVDVLMALKAIVVL